jgi:hypothetical protein
MPAQRLNVVRQVRHGIHDLGLRAAEVHKQTTLRQKGTDLVQLPEDNADWSGKDYDVGPFQPGGHVSRSVVDEVACNRLRNAFGTLGNPDDGAAMRAQRTGQRAAHQAQADDGDPTMVQ